MSTSAPPPPARLRRAADAERVRLVRDRDRIIAQRDGLRAELERLDEALAEIHERFVLLDRLAPRQSISTVGPQAGRAVDHVVDANDAHPSDMELRGTAIRETAVRLLAESPEGTGPIHYRRWYELLKAAGYRIRGKDPLAVFLTQVSRSPAVSKALAGGVYELDRDAARRLRDELEHLQVELRRATEAEGPDLATARRHREALSLELGRVERQLEETERSLAPAGSSHRPALRVARP